MQVIKAEYCLISEVYIFSIDQGKAIFKTNPAQAWKTIPAGIRQINIVSTPQREGGVTTYTTTGTIRIPKQYIEPTTISRIVQNEILLKITTVEGEELIFGDLLHPIRATAENIIPSAADTLPNITLRFKGEDTHGGLYPLSPL